MRATAAHVVLVLTALALLVLLAVPVQTGCNPPRADVLETVLERGVLRIGTDPQYVPFEWEEEGDTLIGFDVDLAKAIGKHLGVKVTFIPSDFTGIIPKLTKGDFDCIISGMTITDDRKKSIDFSQPYFRTGQAILLNRKHEGTITSWEQLKDTDHIITVQGGTTGAFAAEEMMGNPDRIRRYDRVFDAALMVQNDTADALVFDAPFIVWYLDKQPEAGIGLHLDDPFTLEDFGIAVAKGQAPMLDAINEALRKFKEDGTLIDINVEWFGPEGFIDLYD